jgi:hypothetical protein
MKLTLTKTVFPFALLIVAACGARTPFDLESDETSGSDGGAGGLIVGAGGKRGSMAGGAGGSANTGGSFNTGGWRNTGGFSVLGGQIGVGGYTNAGGRNAGGSGGVAYGGSTLVPTGGRNAGGSAGNAGGAMSGGIGGMARGGAGGAVAGGSAGTIKLDSGVGGSAGVIGSDGGPDVRDVGPDRIDSRPNDGAGGAVACPVLSPNEDMIDDLNDGDRFIPGNSGRVGAWKDSHDTTPTGSMYPDPQNPFTPTDTGDPCRKYAAYVKGAGFSDWGADFSVGLGSPYNASKYTGITFWAKSDASASQVLRVSFPDKDTHQNGGLCKPNSSGAKQCNDHYGTRPTLTPTWTKFTILFKDLSQDGWGMQAAAFDPSTLFEILFQIPENASFAIWVDDLAFTL